MSTTPIRRKQRAVSYGQPIMAPTHGDTVAPQNDLAVAAWLPVSVTSTNVSNGFFAYDYQEGRSVILNKLVLMPGKLVALTREALTNTNSADTVNAGTVGRLVPAGVRLAWKAAGGSDAVLEYTTVDMDEGIEDLTTGKPVAGAVSYTKTQVSSALQKRGLIRSAETCDELISRPIGVSANVVFAWAGGDGTQPNNLRFHNHRRENKSTFWTGQDHTLRLPVLPKTSNTTSFVAITSVVSTLAHLEDGTSRWFQGDQSTLGTLLGTRYGTLTNQDWVAFALGVRRIESNLYNKLTIKTSGGTDVTSNWLVTEVKSPEQVTKKGLYFVDRDLGLVFFYQSGADALPVGIDDTSLSTSHTLTFSYTPTSTVAADDAVVPATIFAAVTGDVKPGDYLAYDKFSNFVPYVPRPDETGVAATDGESTADANDDATVTVTEYVDPTTYHRPEDIVGKCYTLDRSPKADLAIVKTFHDYDGVSLADRVPGSANDGHPAEIHQALGGQFAAIVRVLL